jgi:hypothetical protein
MLTCILKTPSLPNALSWFCLGNWLWSKGPQATIKKQTIFLRAGMLPWGRCPSPSPKCNKTQAYRQATERMYFLAVWDK